MRPSGVRVKREHGCRADEGVQRDQVVHLDLRAEGDAQHRGLPTTRLPVMPPSPPKNSGSISDIDHTSSPMPSVIMAKVVPAFLVVT
jgi:hypothetical protein